MTAEDRFCALCGKGVDDEVETSVFRLDLSKPAAEKIQGADASPLARATGLWASHRKLIIALGAAALLLVVVIGSVLGAAGRSAPVTSAVTDSGSDEATAAAPVPEETQEPEFTPVPIIPHYSPSGDFAAVDPAVFTVAGWDGVTFLSPSGNVGCAIASDPDGYWGCAINERHWTGEGLEAIGTGATQARLAGEQSFPGAVAITNGGSDGQSQLVVLQYGQSIAYGAVTCYAESIGISCQHAVSGHGFTIARDRNDLY